MSDVDRWQFVVALDKSNVVLTEWEKNFIGDLVEREWKVYTPRMRARLDQMINKYASRIEW